LPKEVVPVEIHKPIRPRVHKAFQNQDQDQAQVKKIFYYGTFLKPSIIIELLTVGI